MFLFLGHLPRRTCCKWISDYLRFFSDSGKRWTSERSESKKPTRKRKENHPIKTLNWQNKQLFGPLVKPQFSKKDDLEPNAQIDEKEQIINAFEGIKKIIKIKTVESEINKSRSNITKNTIEPPYCSDSFVNIEDIYPDLTSADDKGKITIPNTFPLVIIQNKTHSNAKGKSFQLLRNQITPKIEENRFIPSVTTVLNKSMSPKSLAALEEWRKKMVEKLGEEGFNIYQQEIFQVGATLHSHVQEYLQGKSEGDIDFTPKTTGYWNSLKAVLPQVTDPLLIEAKVEHPYLHYRGVIDCIAKYRNKTVLIEWKTSEKQKPLLRNTFDNPLQLAAYIGAVNFSRRLAFQIDSGLIVVCYPNGQEAHAHLMSPEQCLEAWKQWLIRLQQYWEKRNTVDVVDETKSSQILTEETLEFSERSGFDTAIFH